MTLTHRFLLLALLLIGASTCFAQSKKDYHKLLKEDAGEWYPVKETMETDMEMPQPMPEMKMICTMEGDALIREMVEQDESGNWNTVWQHTETYDPENNKIVYEGKDTRMGDYHGEYFLADKDKIQLTEYNSDNQKILEAIMIRKSPKEVHNTMVMFMGEDGQVSDAPVGKMAMVWRKE